MSSSKLKLPEFIQRNPAAWFYVCEAYFATNKIVKNEEKYGHMVAALPSTVTELLLDVLCVEPHIGPDGKLVDERYTLLKDRLLALYAYNDYEAFVAVLDYPPLAVDQKPSTLLSALLALVPNGVKTDEHWLFKNMFLHKLPSHVRHSCRTQNFPSLMAMALFADNVTDPVGKRSLPLQSVTAEAEAAATAAHQVDQAVTHTCCAISSGPGAPVGRTGTDFCFYHRRFKERANKCEAPCAWKRSGSGNGPRAGVRR